MKKDLSKIPIHKLKDRESSGIFLRYVGEDNSFQKDRIMAAHRDDHYIFLLQQGGTCHFMIDFQERTIESTSVYCVLPGQVHYYKTLDNVSGWFLAIDTLLVEAQYRRVFEEEITHLMPLRIDNERNLQLEKCFQAAHQSNNSTASGIKQSITLNLANACIGLIASAYLNQNEKVQLTGNRTTDIARQFHSMLKTEFRVIKAPSEYAAALNISLSYLNECVKTNTGMPVSTCIQQEIMLEAKRLLYYTSLTVKEIAYDLGYEDHTYLSRLFLKATGVTPGQFRKDYHE
jgi:AraC-like DNA-binding protein